MNNSSDRLSEDMSLWGENPPVPWVRSAADRWALLVKRAAEMFLHLFALSPLPHIETELLVFLWQEPESAEPAVLADRLRFSRQTLTGILDKLESAGYLARTYHPTDRRRRLLRLRAKGERLVRSFVGAVLRREASLFESKPEAEVSATLDELERLLTMAESWKAVLEQRGDALP